MPPLPPAPGLAKVTFTQTYAGRQFGDSVYVHRSDNSSWTVAQLNTLCGNASVEYGVYIAPLQNGNLSQTSTDALDLSDTVGRVGHATGFGPGTSGLLDPLPLNVVAHVSIFPGRRYRGGRPGYNFSGLDRSDSLDQRQWKPARVAVFNTAFLNMMSALVSVEGAPVTWAVVSYHNANVVRPAPLVTVPTASEVQQRICTLRRRLGKGISG